ncbi:biotin biosynthesis bifunctional protein BioHC-like isoform X2 [Phyllobates terribilis]|uniref:biotin biosynthesis bifunctional protein BioHC-like isoform X2 n=1 Tax=Phyllobates terribilis TaxID=111132 RepID=UPI003CCB2AD2
MIINFFKKMSFSLIYQKHMIPVSNEITNIVLSYVKVKTNGRPLEMAVDVGCGTGRYTLPLAPHFKKVLGLDISESQINVAKQMTLAKNVSYMVAPAENLPMKDASMDLVHAGLAAHFFTIDQFLDEAVRVLKTRGCLAFHGFEPPTELEYKNVSNNLSVVMSENHRYTGQDSDLHSRNDWIHSVSCWISAIQRRRCERSRAISNKYRKRFREILGEEADFVRMNMPMKYYCVLACKH